jgi:hypothetical protein
MLAALIRWLRTALYLGVGFTGVQLWFAIGHDNVGGAALYGLLLALCVLGLTVKSANNRTT